MHALGQTEIMPFPTPSQTEPDTVAYWTSYFQRETITGPVAGTTPIVTSQSPPPAPYPVYPPISYSQPTPPPVWINVAALALGGLLLFFLVRGIRA